MASMVVALLAKSNILNILFMVCGVETTTTTTNQQKEHKENKKQFYKKEY